MKMVVLTRREKMRLELGIIAGDNTKTFLADLTNIVERFEKAADRLSSSPTNKKTKITQDDLVVTEEASEPWDTTKEKKKKVANGQSFDDAEEETGREDEDTHEEENDDEEEEKEASPPAKKAKAVKKEKLPTLEDCNDAAMECAGRTNRANVLSILKKHFNVKSITSLEKTDYTKFISLMNK